MEWRVIDSVVCPRSNMTFVCVISSKNLKLIVWTTTTLKLKSGDRLLPTRTGYQLNRNPDQVINVVNATPFRPRLWQILLQNRPGRDMRLSDTDALWF
ncbi:hypothetical protein CYR40_06845 [Chimaeribacter arupi]|uniref:Uncharacterized protein n=1 Tax=Chimaeribacter arupi TaxID=2060066 RepID=A0A2N5ENR4_9GAMM|nr:MULTISPECIES: hypothetical protein [Yersiniaceae]PLR36091.1 hypothetical protein CYR23_07235 [Chimaeribacter arupi]PLR44918.1 hypothetical protein CYR52_17770 [Chimaeribacter arupi]PLR48291.1 hypothetical protein CYR40_06845 [Chimaeribacter arupi]PLR50604.1 hypothetical protein CYR34_08835 [Chimaeribacter arupi]WKZ93214.1 hypothetical protein P0E69_04625 [Chimaeribacter arupi]